MQRETEQLRVGREPDAVPRARAFALAQLHDLDADQLSADVALVVTELVTNALLHVGPPVFLRLLPTPDGVRIEVQDSGSHAPLRGRAGADGMTGRGIRVVEALTASWGIERVGGGKVVWCELRAGSADLDATRAVEEDIDALLAAWDDVPDGEVRYRVDLGDVPTDLLLAAKAHVDNLVREFALASAGAASGHSALVPAHLAELIETVVNRFAEARQAIKRQALAASARGETRTQLTLELTAGSVDAGEDYLAAMDEVDAYARAARLLTLETPPQHRLFRRWYVESLVEQLRRIVSGGPQIPPKTLEQRLLEELGTVAAAQRASAWAARLQQATAAFAQATSGDDVARVVVTEGVRAMGASGGVLFVPRGERELEVIGAVGFGEPLVERLRGEARDAALPAASTMRTRQAVWLESRQERDERFPELRNLEPETMSVCAVPLLVGDRVVGAMRFSFDAQHLFDAEERAFVEALAAQAAQALDRSVLYEAERVARASAEELAERLERFQRVTGELAAAATVEDIAEVVVTHAAQALDSPLASVSLVVADDTLRLVRVTGARAGVAKRWETYPISAALPASEAVRNNAPVIVYTRQELRDRFPSVAGDVEDERSLVCVPLSIGDLRLGVISLSFEPSRDVADPAHLRFLTTLADACAQALQRANALAEARVAGDKLSFLAEASAELARSLDYRVTLGNVARLIVPRLADWCSIQIIDGGQLVTVAVAHTDPAMVELASELQERYPVDPNAPTGAPNVIRTGEPELYPDITDEMIVAGAIDEEHLRVIRELGLSSVLTVPLTGATGTFGAISLVATDSGRHYDEDDVAFASDLARRAAVAVENAEAFQRQTGRLAAITRIAEAAQHAILPPVPRRVGCIDIEAAYTSAAREALVGGDLYEVVSVDGGVRLIIGDVRGKGLDAVRMATVVLGEFRAAAVDRDNIAAVARQMDQRLRSYLGDEDFVTALIAQIGDDGTCEVVCCGHPPALVAAHGGYRYIGNADSLPLGLGADPQPASTVLEPGDRLLLYTDGLLEARGADGKFIELDEVAAPLTDGPLDSVLERIQASLKGLVGGSLADDLALLVAEYRPA